MPWAGALKQWRIERIYGFSIGRQIVQDGSAAIEHSARRYIDLLSENH